MGADSGEANTTMSVMMNDQPFETNNGEADSRS